MQIPLGSGARELGIRPSIFADVGSVFGVKAPQTQTISPAGQFREILNSDGKRLCLDSTGNVAETIPTTQDCSAGLTKNGTTIPGFVEEFLGNTWRPRVTVGIGINWQSPFGPFRIDIAKALVKYPGDDPKLFTFNVGTSFQ
jgi:outer membrane protein insertion porin family